LAVDVFAATPHDHKVSKHHSACHQTHGSIHTCAARALEWTHCCRPTAAGLSKRATHKYRVCSVAKTRSLGCKPAKHINGLRWRMNCSGMPSDLQVSRQDKMSNRQPWKKWRH
jgi:hypothetical protein